MTAKQVDKLAKKNLAHSDRENHFRLQHLQPMASLSGVSDVASWDVPQTPASAVQRGAVAPHRSPVGSQAREVAQPIAAHHGIKLLVVPRPAL